MSRKKSYMNYNRILSESVLKDFMKYFNIIKKFKFSGLSNDEKQLLKSPKIRKALSNFNSSIDSFYDELNRQRKKIGLEPLTPPR